MKAVPCLSIKKAYIMYASKLEKLTIEHIQSNASYAAIAVAQTAIARQSAR